MTNTVVLGRKNIVLIRKKEYTISEVHTNYRPSQTPRTREQKECMGYTLFRPPTPFHLHPHPLRPPPIVFETSE